MDLIEPENIHIDNERYAPDAWDYPRRCADVELALDSARERVEEWDRDADPHGWWHERPHWIALHNEVVRLRAERERLIRTARSYVDSMMADLEAGAPE